MSSQIALPTDDSAPLWSPRTALSAPSASFRRIAQVVFEAGGIIPVSIASLAYGASQCREELGPGDLLASRGDQGYGVLASLRQ